MKFPLSRIKLKKCRNKIPYMSIVLIGCLSIGPSNVRVEFNSTVVNLVKGLPSSQMKLYYINHDQALKIQEVYKDIVLVQNFINNGDLEGLDSLISNLYSDVLKNTLTTRVSPLIDNLPLEAARRKFETQRDEFQQRIEDEKRKLRQIEEKKANYYMQFADLQQEKEDLQNEFLTLKNEQQRLVQQLMAHYSNHPNPSLRYLGASEENLLKYQNVNAPNGSCARFKKDFELITKIHSYCYIGHLSHDVTDSRENYSKHKVIFDQYVQIEHRLLTNSSHLVGTIERELAKLDQHTAERERQISPIFGTIEDIDYQIEEQKLAIEKHKFDLTNLEHYKNSNIIRFLGKDFVDIKEELSKSIDLTSRNTAYMNEVMSILSTIPAKPLSGDYTVDFDREAFMMVLQIDAADREMFPIFSKAHILDVNRIRDLDEVVLQMSHGSIEFTTDKGAITTLIIVIGERLSQWQRASH